MWLQDVYNKEKETVMKVLLYAEGLKKIGKSGLGKAIKHQQEALSYEKIPYTLNLKDDYDILHINTWFLKSYFIAKRAKRRGKKIVYHAHSTEEDYRDGFILGHQTSKLIKWWLIKCYKLGDVVVTPTPYAKKILSGYKGLEEKKIYDISNGINIDFWKKDAKRRTVFRKKYGFTEDDKVIVGIGLYIRRKGIVDFVELAKRLPEYKFIWFGESPLSVATEDVKKAVRTKLPNLIFAGYVEKEGIRDALDACDLYFMPTLEETEGIPVIEASAMKCNILIRDIPIFADWFQEGKDLYKGKNIEEFEEKIKGILTAKLPSLKGNAYSKAEERDIKTVGKKLHAVYNDVMEQE